MNLLIIGFGYSAQAFAAEIAPFCESITVTARSPEKVAALRDLGWDAVSFDGNIIHPAIAEAMDRATLLLVSAPPGDAGDPVLRSGLLAHAMNLRRVLYLSTVGVYGDHQGAWVDEDTPLRPVSQRSQERVEAESRWQAEAAANHLDLGIFRLSGIYGPGRSAIDNLRAGTARRIIKPGQVFNRIHVEDIAGALVAATKHDGALGIFNLTDDEPAPPEDVVEYAAHLIGLPVPPDIPFAEATLSEMGRSFYGEVKRVSNAKIKRMLGYAFRCPTFRDGLRASM